MDWADIEKAIIHAYECGYISGHNDEMNGVFDGDTNHVSKHRSKAICEALKNRLSDNSD